MLGKVQVQNEDMRGGQRRAVLKCRHEIKGGLAVLNSDELVVCRVGSKNFPNDHRVGKRHRRMHEVADAAFNDVFSLNICDTRTAVGQRLLLIAKIIARLKMNC